MHLVYAEYIMVRNGERERERERERRKEDRKRWKRPRGVRALNFAELCSNSMSLGDDYAYFINLKYN